MIGEFDDFPAMTPAQDPLVETGWLLDDGLLCIGAGCDHGLGMVTYTDPNAIRFARQQDADAFVRVLRGIGFNALAANVRPVDHQWS